MKNLKSIISDSENILSIEEDISLKTFNQSDELFQNSGTLEIPGLNSRTTVIVPGIQRKH